MATIANNVKNVLRHHVPLIRFKYGTNQSGTATQAVKETKAPSSGTTSSSKTTVKSATYEFTEVPNKYRRRPLTQDEIDLVTVGGFT